MQPGVGSGGQRDVSLISNTEAFGDEHLTLLTSVCVSFAFTLDQPGSVVAEVAVVQPSRVSGLGRHRSAGTPSSSSSSSSSSTKTPGGPPPAAPPSPSTALTQPASTFSFLHIESL
ncbi:hypothetical protein EYF80_025832 [Liparis tanakae]|uniref:Uncharacterized protein n=1 Tax=Liparis tanakae TaxID=230148 RepID=A0A4Z2HEK2_9TELE|nr:hypothetical protein EYF80_025832 [Liparis tanakae]